MTNIRKAVFALACLMLAGWLWVNQDIFTYDDVGMRTVISIVFAALIIARWKPGDSSIYESAYSGRIAVAGTILTLIGVVFTVHQIEWIGVLTLVMACMRWALPSKYSGDIALALLIVYMIKPIPGSVYENIQLLMQGLSVSGAEFLMHCLNVRVWADGFVLQTGARVFDVPEACSGMRTAVTVLLGVIGAGILMRLSFLNVFLFSVFGLLQVLAANILRLTFMVYWSERMPPEWSSTFLHDTTGMLLLAVIILVMAEMSAFKIWKYRRLVKQKSIDSGELEEPEMASILPRFWLLFLRWGWIGLAVIGLAIVIAGAVYKNRAEHRAAMISEVADGLFSRDLDAAERAIGSALKMSPEDREVASQQVRVLTMRGKYQEALDKLRNIGNSLSTYEKIMKSWSLMGTGKAEEAIDIINSLSAFEKDQPGVSIVLAEYAVMQKKPAEVARHTLKASQSSQLIERVRDLFLYLAAHGQWRTIVDSDNRRIPYQKLEHALIAVHANQKLNRTADASSALRNALATWPSEPRLLSSIFNMATASPSGEWEDLYAQDLIANIGILDTDRLVSCMSDSFRLNRPDLAWLAYNAIKKHDPRDPALYMAPAKFGEVWFTFRRHKLWLPSEHWNSVIDLSHFYSYTKNTRPFSDLWANIPLADEFISRPIDQIRSSNIKACIAELDSRSKAGTISQRMEFTYPSALSFAGRLDDAHRKLDELAVKYPEKARDINFQHAVLFDQCGQWQESYELLRKLDDGKDEIRNLPEDLLRVNALMNLNMGVCALSIVSRLNREFYDSPDVDLAAAAIWDVFGYKDQALYIMEKQGKSLSGVVVQLMVETGRYKQAEKLASALGMPRMKKSDPMKQIKMLPKAEMSVQKRFPVPLDQAGMEKEAGKVKASYSGGISPFITKLAGVEEAWYRSGGSKDMSKLDKWASVGRDNNEKATALHRLSVLLGRQARYPEAMQAVQKAIEYIPDSEVLWRLAVSLSEGRQDIVVKAAAACPGDPEIWLACLVTSQKTATAGKPVISEEGLRNGLKILPVEHVIRAGDFLLRNGHIDLALLCSDNAVARADGLLTAYIFGLRCAFAKKDVQYAKKCSLLGIENALDPAPFYQTIIDVSGLTRVNDADMVSALEYMRARFPESSVWGERLGQLYFQAGDSVRALNVLGPVIELGAKSLRVESIIIAAESARLEGRGGDAIRILDTAYSLYPEKLSVFNNYVYGLSADASTLQKALDLLPKLLAAGEKNAAVLDTAAVVYFRAGNLEKAREYSDKALKNVIPDDYSTLEVYLNAATILYHSGRAPEAKALLDKILTNPKRSGFIDNSARSLNDKIKGKGVR